MNKYWVVGTSTKKYIKNYIEILSKSNIGDLLHFEPYDSTKIVVANVNNDELLKFSSTTTMKQCLCAWESLGLVKTKGAGFYLLIDFVEVKDGYDLTKYNLLHVDNNNKVNKYRFSKLINILFQAGWITMSDIKKMEIEQTRGILKKSKIVSEIGDFEKYVSKDEFYLKRIMEVINDYKF